MIELLVTLIVFIGIAINIQITNLLAIIFIAIFAVFRKSFRIVLLIVAILLFNLLVSQSLVLALLQSIHTTLHSDFSQFISNNFSKEYSTFLISITIGTADVKLSKDVYNLFKNFNLLHVVSISGANFAFIKELFEKLSYYINKKIVYLVISVIQTYYIFLIGFNNFPALRAYIFSIIAIYSILVGRPISFISKLLLTIIIIVAISPTAITNSGFLLSISFSLIYKSLELRPFKRIFNNELKKLSLIFIISVIIFNSNNPDFIANIVFAIIYPFIFVLTFLSYFAEVLNFNTNIAIDLIKTLVETILNTLGQLSSAANELAQLTIFIAILITIFISLTRQNNNEYLKLHQ